MTSCPPGERLQQFLREEVSGAEAPAIAAHIEGCRDCAQALERLAAQTSPGGNVALSSRAEPAPAFFEKLRELYPFAREPQGKQRSADGESWPEIPNYEIVRRLGKGGMGVVYQ